MQEQAELVGAIAATGCAIGAEVGLPRFDVVLRLPTSAVDILIDGTTGWAAEAGDDEACVGALRSGLYAAMMRSTRSQLAAASWNSLNRRSFTPSAAVAARAAVLSSRLRTCLRNVEVGATPSV